MKLVHVLLLFATLGLALAKDFFANLGVDASPSVIGAFGLAVTTLLILNGLLPLIAVLILTFMIGLPEEILQPYNLDEDFLLAIVLTILLYPWLRKLAHDA